MHVQVMIIMDCFSCHVESDLGSQTHACTPRLPEKTHKMCLKPKSCLKPASKICTSICQVSVLQSSESIADIA